MKKRPSLPKMQRTANPRLALEPRIVFDAALAATGAEVLERQAEHSEYVPPPAAEPVRDKVSEPAAQPAKPE
ncbi:hypothetical protein, partial [Polaromonas sp.]|uniref:hypothetical protein n=1 Tax=Polaromonas sp. TaxID=1869339 RepID=UPI00286CFA16